MNQKQFMLELGQKIRKQRKWMGMSQHELALKAGVDMNYVSQIENAKRLNVSLWTICKLCDVVEISIQFEQNMSN